ncbi:MAG: Rrf2 family transcriptional regulator, partial [Patescibacteria group bacterium]
LSFSFMQKIAHFLKRAGLVQSCRGKEGGYRLTRSARTITVRNIVDALEGHRQNMPRRKLGTPTSTCPQRNFCALRSAAAHMKDQAVGIYLAKRLTDIL